MKLRKKEDNVAGKAIAMREASQAQFEREQEERSLVGTATGAGGPAPLNVGPAAGTGRRVTRPGSHNSSKSKGSNGTGTKRGSHGEDIADDSPSDAEHDDDDTARPPAKKARKNRDTAQRKRERDTSRGAKAYNGDDAKVFNKKKRTAAIAASLADLTDGNS